MPEQKKDNITTSSYSIADLCDPLIGISKEQADKMPAQIVRSLASLTFLADPRCEISVRSDKSILVRADDDQHSVIVKLLNQLRRAMNLQVVIETRIIEHADLNGLICDAEPDGRSHRLLSEKEFGDLTNRIASQKRAVILAAPKVTSFSGQKVSISTDLTGKRTSVNRANLLGIDLCGRVESMESIRLDMSVTADQRPMASCQNFSLPTEVWLLMMPAVRENTTDRKGIDARPMVDQNLILVRATVIESQ